MFAARLTDKCTHPVPGVLTGSLGSPDVSIGGLPAWRAVPAALGAALDAASNAIMEVINSPTMNPVLAALMLAPVKATLGTAAGMSDNPVAAATTQTALSTMEAGMVALDTTWTSASAAPGGQPAADEAYAQGLAALLATAAAAAFSAAAAGMDIHMCGGGPIPHGPGVVTAGSSSVTANGLPLARSGDSVMEAAGGANPIVQGHVQVTVG